MLGQITVDRLPGTNIYSLSSIAGSLSCYQGHVTFESRDGSAIYVERPNGWNSEEGDACFLTRQFGTLAGQPVAFQIGDGVYLEWLHPSIRVSPWTGDHFALACRAVFDFAPAFAPAPDRSAALADDESMCMDGFCRRLRQSVVALIARVQDNPAKALSDVLAQLDDNGRKSFLGFLSDGKHKQPKLDEPPFYSEWDPLYAPLEFEHRLYLATIANVSDRGIAPQDWNVNLDPKALGETGDDYTFTIEMRPGRFLGAHVE